jgi:hypothetical protein
MALNCERAVLTLAGDGLDRFFADLASDWRGWKDVRRWDALESGMTSRQPTRGIASSCCSSFRRDYTP